MLERLGYLNSMKMIDNKIPVQIGKAIREGKYLNVSYKNAAGESTQFWMCVLDITGPDQLRVNMFNVTKDNPILDGRVFVSAIQSAEILRFSYYDVPETLIKKLEDDERLQMFSATRYDNDILNYYMECHKANKDPFLHKTHLITGLDLSGFENQNPCPLTAEQQKQIIKDIYQNDYKRYYDYELALSEFSIDLLARGKFVVAFRKLRFNPVNNTLHLESKTRFNSAFYIQGTRYSLSYYTDLNPADFETMYVNGKSETIEMLSGNFKAGELPNTRPEVVVLGYEQFSLSEVYDTIYSAYRKNEMEVPLKAFFQRLSLLDRKNRTEPNIVLFDKHVNIDQLRTVYNALKYPVTYVQGPPGTGKTQTILNIIVNCLVNAKTLLITSNNNVPIDGIKENLYLGKYRDKEIHLPVIRLGNKECVKQALQTIRKLYDFDTKDVPKDALLANLKKKSKEKNQLLLDRLKLYEARLDVNQNLEFVNRLLSRGSNHLLEKEKRALDDSLAKIPEITAEDLSNTFEVIKDNDQLLQFFYYESLRYVKRLRTKEYSELIEISTIENENEQVSEFNRWLANDDNLEKFTKIFPVILTTNLSSRRLGKNYKFDLLTIDEAAQCDIATSLVPISKCKAMVLIGDTNQLKPIVVFEETRNKQLMEQYQVDEAYDYYNNSVLSTYKRIDNISRDILLSYHYRCGTSIINFSNMRFYEDQLNLSKITTSGEVKLIDVNNANQKAKNATIEEAQEIIKYISDNKLSDVFILTPFRNQEAVINHYLNVAKEKGEIDPSINCGTIHKVQGRENQTIILSTAISRSTTAGTYEWIKNNSQLINVGVTRAKERLVVVADKRAVDILSRKDDDLYALIEYVKKNGTTKVVQSVVNKFTIGFSNNSVFEDEFYKTMSHYCTVQGARFERNVKVTDVFPEEFDNPALNKKEFDGVVFEGRMPKVIFEVNGAEHSKNKKRIESDTLKMQLASSKDIKLILIPNQFVKHYEYIRELMIKIKGGVYQKMLFEV